MKPLVSSLLAATGLAALLSCASLRQPEARVDFVSQVKPVLERRCLECHNADYVFAGLRMETKDLMMKGGRSGPVIVSGHPDQSLLYKVLLLGHSSPVAMPPTPEGTFEEEKDLIRTWIAQGAEWPEGVKLVPPQNWPSSR